MANEFRDVHYYDINSLYPFIAQVSEFPCGDAKWLVGPENCHLWLKHHPQENKFTIHGKKVDGIVKCRIYLPRDADEAVQFIPFIPTNYMNKVYRVSCHACLETKSQSLCQHTNQERAIIGTYYLHEILYALKIGYRVDTYFEIMYYEDQQPFLRSYFSLLASQKIRFQGVPPEYLGDEETYCDEINESLSLKHDIEKLSPLKLRHDATSASFYKFWLNASLGKFSQRSTGVTDSLEFVTSRHRLNDLLNDQTLEIRNVTLMNESTLALKTRSKSQDLRPNLSQNCVIGGSICSKARIYLHEFLIKLQRVPSCRVSYCDTDSIIFSLEKKYNVQDFLPIHSTKLGFFKSEIKTDAYIKEVIILSPKNYAITTCNKVTGKEHYLLKVKGLTVKSEEATNQLSSSHLRDMLHKFQCGEAVTKEVTQFRIKINQKTLTLSSEDIKKKYSNFTLNKRYYRPSMHEQKTWPYGVVNYT